MANMTELVTKFSFTGSLAPLDKLNQGLKIGITTIGAFGVASGASVLALNSFVSSTFEANKNLINLSNLTGISYESLQEWSFVAKASGSSAEALTGSIESLSEKIGEYAKFDSGEGKEIFESLGIAVKDASGQVKSADVVMGELQQKLQGISGAEKVSILTKLGIDRSMINVLSQSSDEFEKLKQRARAFLLTDAEKSEMQEYSKSFEIMGSSMDFLKNKLALAFSPQLRKLSDQFTDLLVDNKDLISNGFNKFGEVIGATGRAVFKFINLLVDLVKNNSAVQIGLGLFIANFARLNAVMLLNPVGAVIAGVTALILIYDDLTSENSYLIEKFNELKEKGSAFVGELKDSIVGSFEEMKNKIKGFIDNIIQFFQPLIDTVNGLVESISNISLDSINPFSSGSDKITPQVIANPNTMNAVPNSIMNKSLSNQVNNNQQIKIEVKTENPKEAGQEVVNQLNQQFKTTNALSNNGGN